MKKESILATILFASMAAASGAQGAPGYARPEMLVQTGELARDGASTQRRIVDARSAEAYAQGQSRERFTSTPGSCGPRTTTPPICRRRRRWRAWPKRWGSAAARGW